jgi:MFS family permease
MIAGWRTIFFINVPIGIFASFIVWRFVPPSERSSVKQRFDTLGALLITVTLTCFALGMTEGQNRGFGSGTVLTLLAVSAITLACFLAVQARIKQPMLDLRIFRNLQFSLSLLMGLLVFIVIAGVIFILPFFLELVKHYSTQQVGLLLAVAPVLGGIVAPFSGSLSDRFGSRIISLVGLVLMVIGCLLVSTFDAQLTEIGYMVKVAPFGIGLGMFQSPNNSAIMGGVSRDKLGIASGLLSLSRTLGQTTGLPLLGALFAALTLSSANLAHSANVITAPHESLIYGLQITFRVGALILLAATVLTAVVWRMERPSR